MAEKRPNPFDDDRGDNKRPALGSNPLDIPERTNDGMEEIVRPMFWSGYTGSGRRRTVQARDTARDLRAAYSSIIHLEGQLTFDQQRELFPYIFWPPVPSWCLVPFDMQGCPKGIRADDGAINPLIYGMGARSNEHIWKQAVLGIFQPQRRHYQIFDHILVAIHSPWADETCPDEVPMWGLVHYQKGADTAYVHVMTEWQEWVFNNNLTNTRWAANLVETLTCEAGVDDNLFLGDNPAIKIQWVANLTGPDWSSLGTRGETTEEVSNISFLYVIYAATKLAIHNFRDTSIPEFTADDAYGSLAQALLGVSTALEHGEEGNIRSVRGGITEGIRAGATDSVREFRESLDNMLAVSVADYQRTLGSTRSIQDLPLLPGNPGLGSGSGS